MQGKLILQQWSKPIIRKLIRQGSVFTCSLCKGNYSSRGEAYACLSTCWDELAAIHPIHIAHRMGQKSLFRCNYCSRDYDEDFEALSCAEQCRQSRDRRHEREQRIAGITPVARPKLALRTSRVGQPMRAGKPSLLRSQGAKPKTDIEAKPSSSATSLPHAESPVVTENPSSESPPPGGKATPGKGRSRMSFAKPYVRHNAKYKCACCNTLYFTKSETETCFMGHFDAEGFEIVKSETV